MSAALLARDEPVLHCSRIPSLFFNTSDKYQLFQKNLPDCDRVVLA